MQILQSAMFRSTVLVDLVSRTVLAGNPEGQESRGKRYPKQPTQPAENSDTIWYIETIFRVLLCKDATSFIYRQHSRTFVEYLPKIKVVLTSLETHLSDLTPIDIIGVDPNMVPTPEDSRAKFLVNVILIGSEKFLYASIRFKKFFHSCVLQTF